jgi:eukaryotic-like serine/threonine-protein kinase
VNRDEPQELPEGARLLDRYTIIDRIAGGGMATIYRAMDERLDRVVCVKLLRLELEGSGSTSGGAVYKATYSHFLREALALSKLQHPNTLRIYDFGYLEDGQRPFQISEFLDGGNLEQHLRARGALSPDENLAILERITGAIAEAHEQKIIHRDIKPSNILFSRVGEVLMPKLADFGIAQTNLQRRSHSGELEDWDSVSSIALFSPRWAAPEQLTGTAEGPFTDVYALGLVTAYMLTGTVPFDGPQVRETFEARVRSDELVLQRMTQIGLRGPIRQVLMRAMAANPAARIQSPLSFFEDLRNTLGGARTSLPPQYAQPRRPAESVTLSISDFSSAQKETQLVAPTERAETVGGRHVRVVDVYEKLELDLVGDQGIEVRFRVAIVPEREALFRINIKGLNCFVAKPTEGNVPPRATPALSASEDGAIDFVSTSRKRLGRVAFSFGRVAPEGGRVFPLSGGTVVVPSAEAAYAVALDLGPDREIIVMCKRT